MIPHHERQEIWLIFWDTISVSQIHSYIVSTVHTDWCFLLGCEIHFCSSVGTWGTCCCFFALSCIAKRKKWRVKRLLFIFKETLMARRSDAWCGNEFLAWEGSLITFILLAHNFRVTQTRNDTQKITQHDCTQQNSLLFKTETPHASTLINCEI